MVFRLPRFRLFTERSQCENRTDFCVGQSLHSSRIRRKWIKFNSENIGGKKSCKFVLLTREIITRITPQSNHTWQSFHLSFEFLVSFYLRTTTKLTAYHSSFTWDRFFQLLTYDYDIFWLLTAVIVFLITAND